MWTRILLTLALLLSAAIPAHAQLPGGDSISIGKTPILGGTSGLCLYQTTTGKVGEQACGTGTATDITIGTTTITSGTSGRILYDNAGALGEALVSYSAATITMGAADAASPVAQTISVQNVVTGTSNTAGANWTLKASQGTGTGASGSILFQTAAAGSTGSTPNALSTALTLSGSAVTFALASSFSAGTASLPSLYLTSDTTTGWYRRTANAWTFSVTGSDRYELGANYIKLNSSNTMSWGSSTVASSSDTGISRVSAGVVGIGTGAAASVAGTISAAGYTAAGSAGVNCTVGTLNPVTAIVTAGIITHC